MDAKSKTSKIIAQLIVRSKTNEDELAKQYFTYVQMGDKSALVIKKLILSAHKRLPNCKCVRKYEGKHLLMETFGIKPDTFFAVSEWMYKMKPNTLTKIEI